MLVVVERHLKGVGATCARRLQLGLQCSVSQSRCISKLRRRNKCLWPGSSLSETCVRQRERRYATELWITKPVLSRCDYTPPHSVACPQPSSTSNMLPSSGKGLRLSVLVLTVDTAMLCKCIYTQKYTWIDIFICSLSCCWVQCIYGFPLGINLPWHNDTY